MSCTFMAAFLLPESLMLQSAGAGVGMGGHDETQTLVYISQVLCYYTVFLTLGFLTGSYYVAQAGLDLMISPNTRITSTYQTMVK